MDGNEFQIYQCLSLNFGYIDEELSYSQIVLTPDSETEISFDSSTSCVFVLIGGTYLTRIGKVMEKVNSITNEVGKKRPIAAFLMSTNNQNVDIDVDYGFERYKSTPVMVK